MECGTLFYQSNVLRKMVLSIINTFSTEKYCKYQQSESDPETHPSVWHQTHHYATEK